MQTQAVPRDSTLTIPSYAVVGTYASARTTFVKHVALLRKETVVRQDDEVAVWHMGPPLVAGPGKDAGTKAHVAAWLNLSPREMDAMSDWLDGVNREERSDALGGYSVSMGVDAEWQRNETGEKLYRKFSCCTFVLRAYRYGAGIQLLDDDDTAHVPTVPIEDLAQAYHEGLRTHERVRVAIGLPGSGPWPVLLPGFVLHAMDRTEEEIRAVPYRIPGIEAAHYPMAAAPSPKPE